MKKVLIVSLMAFIVIMLYSCKPNPEKIVKNNIKEYVKKHMHDPESYEFVSLTPFDTVLYKDNIENEIKAYEEGIEHYKQSIEMNMESIEFDMQFDNNEERIAKYKSEIEEYKKEIEKYNNILNAFDSIKNALGDKINDIASYTFILECRANNAMGAKILSSFYVQTTPSLDYKIINFTEEISKIVSSTPNKFPGYDEIMNKYEK